ncbi:MAG: type VII toxin-antitoxin system MntA family adenylyltransferase antitoxin [Bacillota bacterium]
MKYKKFFLNGSQKKKTVETVKNILCSRTEINFAYIHGSFTGDNGFRDIDIALYLEKDLLGDRELKYEIDLEIKLEEVLTYPVDVRVLNHAPLSFQFQVIKGGILLFERDEESRVDFQVKTLDFYFDFAPFRRRYLKEMIGIGD